MFIFIFAYSSSDEQNPDNTVHKKIIPQPIVSDLLGEWHQVNRKEEDLYNYIDSILVFDSLNYYYLVFDDIDKYRNFYKSPDKWPDSAKGFPNKVIYLQQPQYIPNIMLYTDKYRIDYNLASDTLRYYDKMGIEPIFVRVK